ncbi:MAG: 16S rRNA (adenine(1518)-N(6)/adenine(1519)-N(6))-dimethyltransferase RsmA [Candidatus Adiutrix sp.]|jgi:16S rRNA (adenine1518-N6/adenine1519-N6)-dimethyltransferase|nr:16S rRNA (adenine(1518)-N(6)/adenine(1519)-N(6))-dimethyltransferase RsmA [Candidatus Adiutrix sp.]
MLIKETLKELGLAPAKSRGQNFLKAENQIERICRAVLEAAGERPELMEIGPGLGALTRPLLAAGAKITAVELDKGLAGNLHKLAEAYPGRLTVLHRDILSLGHDDFSAAEPIHLYGNLPYNISSPVILWFLAFRRFFGGATFMLQKEMARRLAARPGGRDYGRLSVVVSLFCEVKPLMEVPPSAFHPRPQVDSLVLALKLRPPERAAAIDPGHLGRLTAAVFAARRKTVFNNLSRAYGREKAGSALADLKIDPGLRAETLEPGVLAALAEILEK